VEEHQHIPFYRVINSFRLQHSIPVTCWMVSQYAAGVTYYTTGPVTAVTMHMTVTVYVLSAFKKPQISELQQHLAQGLK
jgi:hypothetical protein